MAPSDPHALLLPFPAQGHIIPAMQLAVKLLSQGITATLVCSHHRINLIPAVFRSRVRILALPDDVDLNEETIDAGVESLSRSRGSIDHMRQNFQQLLNSQSLRDARIIMFCDFLLSWTADIAEQFNIPRYVFYPSSAAALCASMYVPSLISERHIPVRSSDLLAARAFIHVPGLADLLLPSDLPSAFREDYPAEGREHCVKSCLLLREPSSGVVVNSFSELEAESFRALQNDPRLNPNHLPIYSVGPLLELDSVNSKNHLMINPEESTENSSCLKWLDTQPIGSVLYISFGSIAELSSLQIQELANALDSSTHRFLWVIRHLSERTVAFSTLLPEGFQLRTKDRGFILFTWAPQLHILSHPSTGGFLTHCGWNSIMESIYTGVPVIALPQFGEQDLNCKVVVEQLQMGMMLKRGEDGVAGREEMERAVRMLMGDQREGENMRSKASEWMNAARMAATGGSSASNFQTLCNSIIITRDPSNSS